MQTLPVIYVTAENNYQVGKVIGTTCRDYIAAYLNISQSVALSRRFYRHQEGRKIYEKCLRNSEQYFPEIVDEIRGLADGSRQRFVDIFLIQMSSEIRHSYLYEFPEIGEEPQQEEDKDCTSIMINTKDVRIIGHNNDWSADVSDYVYLGHVTIINQDGGYSVVREQFVSFMYAGHLPGHCFGMNNKFVYALNSVRPLAANKNGVPLSIILRKMLTCKSINECAGVLENKPLGCSYGINVNIAHVHDDVMCSMEAYQEEEEGECQTRISILTVKDTWYVHTNYYKHADDRFGHPTEGSYIRHRRAEEILTSHPPTSSDDITYILGDTCKIHGMEPIYRTPSAKHLVPLGITSATAVFDMKNRRLDVYKTNPKLAKEPTFSMDFLK